MDNPRQELLVECALSEIDQLLNNFDLGGQIQSALPLLLRHHRHVASYYGTCLSTRSNRRAVAEQRPMGRRPGVRLQAARGAGLPHSAVYRSGQ